MLALRFGGQELLHTKLTRLVGQGVAQALQRGQGPSDNEQV